jgi:hypothetical protein
MRIFQDWEHYCGNLGITLFGFEKGLLIGCYWLEQNSHQWISIVKLWASHLVLQICKCNFYIYALSNVDGVALRCISLFSYNKLSTLLSLSYPTKIVIS